MKEEIEGCWEELAPQNIQIILLKAEEEVELKRETENLGKNIKRAYLNL